MSVWGGQGGERFISVAGDRRVLSAVQQLLQGTQIGEGGRDQGRSRTSYSQLEVVHVWRMNNALVQEQYDLGVRVPPPTPNTNGQQTLPQ